MEKMPFHHRPATAAIVATVVSGVPASASNAWRTGLPVLAGAMITLRELRLSDAPSLLASLTTGEVARFISSPPSTVEGFEQFIARTQQQRAAGQHVCFAVVPRGSETAIGLFQIRALEPGFRNAEWGFAIDAHFWGTGVFLEGAKLAVDFAFQVVGAHRLEARASAENGRGNGALRKIGAVEEALLRRSFLRDGAYHDQVLWTIVRDDWQDAPPLSGPSIVH